MNIAIKTLLPIRPAEAGLIVALATLTAGIILFPKLGLPLVLVVGAGAVLWILTSILHGKTETIMTWWVLLFPLGYFFIAFPREKSVITGDRLLIGILVTGVVFAGRSALSRVPEPLSRCAWAWAAFLAVAGASLFKAIFLMVSARWYLDGFVLPAILGWYVVTAYPVRKHLASLHTFVCLTAAYDSVIGALEFFTRTSVIPLPGSAPLVYAGRFARPHGPFYNDDSFALIGMISLFFMLFLRYAMQDQWSRPRQLLHMVGVVCSVLNSLMPLFRSVGITLLLIMVIDNLFEKRVTKRLTKIAMIAAFVVCLVGAAALVPDATADRSNPDNFYVRIAEQKQVMLVFLDHPLFGIGIWNFKPYVLEESRYVGLYHGTQSLDSPHSNLGSVLSETGIVGFIPYVTAQFLLIMAFFKMTRARGEFGSHIWKYFLYIYLSYWVSGLTLASGYNSDLNMWFMFTLMALYKYAITVENRETTANYTRQAAFPSREPEFAAASR